jgi:ParB family chromosome partitioning protein
VSVADKSKNKGLGRGIDSLFPHDFDRSLLLDEAERIQKISIDLIEPQIGQPRKHFDEKSLIQLGESIKEHGILQPLIVTFSNDKHKYTIIAGERRWRAALIAGLKSLPVIIRSARDLEKLEIALVENVQRVDLSPLEQAESIERLHEIFNQDYATIGKRLGKDHSTIINIVRLLQLPENASKALRDEFISSGHARSILALKDDLIKQDELLDAILKHGWSVRQAERFVVAYKKRGADSKIAKASVKAETPQTKKLSKKLKAPVTIRRMANGGKLEIGFTSEQDLERIINSIFN